MMWDIRLANEQDMRRLAELAEGIFRDTFGEFNTPEDMDSYCAEAFTPAAMSAELLNADTSILIALHEDEPVAYAHLHGGNAPEPVRGVHPAELKRFYVEKKWHGSGLARELMKRVIEFSRERYDADILWLGVWEHNPRAIRFYHNHGFSEVGEQSFVLGTDLQRDLIMSLPIEAIDGDDRTE